ncbi:MAG TPA: oxygenase MpaB family protein [Nocardioidaceae bacterium]|nr:oxygenase MpaB family protein [Nocardioidaceae bacterium]
MTVGTLAGTLTGTLTGRTLSGLRHSMGDSLVGLVAGSDAHAQRERIHDRPGPRWFEQGRPIRQVHADASMFVGGLSALLLQSLHPLAMAAVEGHSGYRGDPWGRLQRTSAFLAMTTFGVDDDAEAAVARVRAVHGHVSGISPDGRRYRASDPHLLSWVHAAEVTSFLNAHQRYGARPLNRRGCDAYVADTAVVAGRLGVLDPPLTQDALQAQLRAFRPEIRSTGQSRAAARFLLLHPPVPWALRPAYAVLSAAAVELMPRWARAPLGLPYLPVVEPTVVRAAGQVLTAGIRYVLTG